MSRTAVNVITHDVNNIATILEIQGHLNTSASSHLLQTYQQTNTSDIRVIILNLSHMHSINGSGIAVLITLLNTIYQNKQQVFAFGLNCHYHHIFYLTNLSDRISLYTSEVDAIKALRPLALRLSTKGATIK